MFAKAINNARPMRGPRSKGATSVAAAVVNVLTNLSSFGWFGYAVSIWAAVSSAGCSSQAPDQAANSALGPDGGDDDGGAGSIKSIDCGDPAFKGTKMVEVQSPSGVKYCMDNTKVTKAQYRVFYKAHPDFNQSIPDQPRCTYVDNFAPVGTFTSGEIGYYPYEWEPDDAPMTSVSYCEAWAYCQWVGKRLCGKVGGGPLFYDPLATDAPASEEKWFARTFSDPEQSEWYNACSQQGTTEFATGGQSPLDLGCMGALDPHVGEMCSGSKAPFDNITGLQSGLWEYEDGCGRYGCVVRGGRTSSADVDVPCSEYVLDGAMRHEWISFRCCADLQILSNPFDRVVVLSERVLVPCNGSEGKRLASA